MPRTRRARLRPVPPRPAIEYAGDSTLHDFQVFRKRARRRPWMVAKKDFHRHDMPRLRALVEAGPTFRFPEPRLVYVVEPWRVHVRRDGYRRPWTRIVHVKSGEARYVHDGNVSGAETFREMWAVGKRTKPTLFQE